VNIRATLVAVAAAFTQPCVVADTVTSGRVTDGATGEPVTWGWVALVTRSTLDLYTPDQQVWFDQLATLDAAGNFVFTIDENHPAYAEFYLYSISPLHHNEVWPTLQSAWTFPLRSDFDGDGAVPLDGLINNPNLSLELDPNRSTHRVLMRDGKTELATDLYLASATREAPTILLRTPYNKDTASYVAWYTVWGYNVVCQDSRGRFASDGLDAVFRADGWGQHQDGYDTIDWIVNQPWGDDNVGMSGGSAVGITQYLCAGANHPALKCCYAIVASGALYRDLFFVGGVFRKHMIEGWLAGQGSSFFMTDVEAHPNDDDWWAEVDIESRVPGITVPFFHVVGWFDIFTEGGVRAFRQLQYDAAEGARGNQKMVIGPWTHGGVYQRQQGELTFPENSTDRGGAFDNDLQFFDYWLKGIDNGFYDTPPVRYYVMGDVDNPSAPGNEWRYADAWPVPATQRSYWFTRAGGLTAASAGSVFGTLTSAGSVFYRFDPADPAPTRGGNNLALPAGPHDQRAVEARSDVIEFTTPVLAQPVEVTGNVRAQLLVSSDQPDTDFMVKLCDVYPDGRSMLIAEGAIHGRHRLGHDSEHLLTPGHLYRLDVDLWSTSIVFNAGHRIRVSVTSSNSPRWEVNPNTGEPFRRHTELRTATNRVFCIPGFGSRIVLPVVQ
jgi:predicted acyl esterase